MSPNPRLIEPRLVRARKRRAAAGFRDAAFLVVRVAADLADRLEAIPRRFERALVLGGGGLFGDELRGRPELAARISEVIEADVAGGGVVVDPELLPFGDAAFDLIVSPLVLHAVNDVPGVLVQMRLALRPDGLLLASLFGGETLNELRLSLLEAEEELLGGAGARVLPFADLQAAAGLLQRTGFALPAADRDVVTVRYGEPMRLLADLRGMGETAALAERHPRNLSRRILARAFEIYRARFSDEEGRLRATFEIITLTGWAPHESQQKPLKPGSAKTRLADALGVTEKSAGEKAGD
jgi:SAM-dependent methyltransferase